MDWINIAIGVAAVIGACSVAARTLAVAVDKLAKATENKTDDKIAKYLGKAANVLDVVGGLLGKVGLHPKKDNDNDVA